MIFPQPNIAYFLPFCRFYWKCCCVLAGADPPVPAKPYTYSSTYVLTIVRHVLM